MGDYSILKRDQELLELVYQKLDELGRNPKRLRGKDKLQALCPFHDDHNPSFYVYQYGHRLYYKCFGCERRGTIWDLARKLQVLPEKHETKEEGKAGARISPDRIPQLIEKAYQSLRRIYEKDGIVNAEVDYLAQRGFLKNGQPFKEALEFIDKYKLGLVDDKVIEEFPEARIFATRLIIPYFDLEEKPVWFVARAVLDEEVLTYYGLPTAKYLQPKDMKARVYNPAALDQALETGYLLVVEGAIDSISVLEATDGSIPVVGVPGGATSVDNPNIREFFKQIVDAGVEVLILTDPDEGGRKIASKLKKMIRDLDGIATKTRLFTPEGEPWKGDINEALRTYGKEKLARMIEDVIERYNEVGDELYIKRFHIIIEREKKKAVYPTGFRSIDNLLGGGYRAGLHIIGGNTAAGKTALALHIAAYNAMKGSPVLYFTYEQSKQELWGRIIASQTDEVSYFDIKDGRIPPIKDLKNGEKILTIARYLKIREGDSGMFDTDETLYTVEEIAHEARRVKEKTGKPPLVIVDYIQRMPAGEDLKRKDLRERVDFIVTGLQTHVARVIGSPVIALSSVSRGAYELKPDSPLEKKIAAFKESGGIEFTGYTVALLIAENSDNDIVNVTFEFLKNRESGKLGRAALIFDKSSSTWEEVKQT